LKKLRVFNRAAATHKAIGPAQGSPAVADIAEAEQDASCKDPSALHWWRIGANTAEPQVHR
jgi:hypothetical protein